MRIIQIGLILSAYILTVFGVGGWRRLALRRQILDIPNERSSHVNPTPRGGGIIIFAVTFVFLTIGAAQSRELSFLSPFLGGAILIAIVSWLDDLYSLPSWLRFGVHTAAALLVIFGIGYFKTVELPFYTINLAGFFLGQIITLLWIVGLTNAYNFMDGIDGIAGGQGLIAGIGWSLAGWLTNDSLILLFGGLLSATNLGFLWHNWHPARIFMGDVGSAFLGFSFAVLPILAMQQTEDKSDLTIFGVLLVWTFIFDAVLTFVRRAKRGENVFAAHRSHLYQRLVIADYSHSLVSLVYGALSIIGLGLAVLWLKSNENELKLIVLIILSFVSIGLWLFVVKAEKNNDKSNR
jgi:UDP-N-acetylmuramyl pentapeptide phosphotransferase/UDP-N-acetylglucosamine-1-phosphate transferase